MNKEEKRIKKLSLKMVRLYLQGYKIQAIGEIIYSFKLGRKYNGKGIMHTTDGFKCRKWLAKNNIEMFRIDSGGRPQWNFKVIN